MTTVILFCLLVILLKVEVDTNNNDRGLITFMETIFPLKTTHDLTDIETENPQANLLHLLTEVAAAPPIIPINDTCTPKKLSR